MTSTAGVLTVDACAVIASGSMLSVVVSGSYGAVLQAIIAPELQGRVFGLIMTLATAMAPLSLSIAGPVAEQLGLPPAIADGIGHVYERWDGKGAPAGLIGEAIPSAVRIVVIARDVDILHRIGGWELVVANVPDTTKAKLHGRASLTTLSNRHYTIELPPHEAPDQWIQTLAADGVEVVSLNPIRTTLEDYFVSIVSAASPRDAGRTEGR